MVRHDIISSRGSVSQKLDTCSKDKPCNHRLSVPDVSFTSLCFKLTLYPQRGPWYLDLAEHRVNAKQQWTYHMRVEGDLQLLGEGEGGEGLSEFKQDPSPHLSTCSHCKQQVAAPSFRQVRQVGVQPLNQKLQSGTRQLTVHISGFYPQRSHMEESTDSNLWWKPPSPQSTLWKRSDYSEASCKKAQRAAITCDINFKTYIDDECWCTWLSGSQGN